MFLVEVDMQFGFVIPKGDPATVAELAREVEAAGWDGAFYWDGMFSVGPGAGPIYDPWVVMAAMAISTERVRIGAIVTPLARRRPWKVAREAVTLDHLSRGRLVLAVGLGAADDGGFARVGEAADRKTRAELVDEGLAIITGLWRGEPFAFDGAHYRLEEVTFAPRPVQTPRIPIWVVAAWPRPASMRRAVRWDGVMPARANAEGRFEDALTPDDLRALGRFVAARRTAATRFDIVIEGVTPGDDRSAAAAIVGPLAESGASWWIESMWEVPNEVDDLRRRIRQGPPIVDRCLALKKRTPGNAGP
jgi:alkanesulfonate monooxygenase SsuD/methylene tetrahydromethanopterin reductase-like flavin-dependent oxidoreductase (luciferase family)